MGLKNVDNIESVFIRYHSNTPLIASLVTILYADGLHFTDI